MTDLLKKLNYKGQARIAVINSDNDFENYLNAVIPETRIDTVIDPRFPYSFIILFVKKSSEVTLLSQVAIHNLIADGILWFCYPKKTSKNIKTDLSRENGWKSLYDSGFYGVRMVSVDDTWSAIRFRNIKYIKSTSGRFPV